MWLMGDVDATTTVDHLREACTLGTAEESGAGDLLTQVYRNAETPRCSCG